MTTPSLLFIVAASIWDRFPLDIEVSIFSFLSPSEVCASACVSRHWKTLGDNEILWKELWRRKWKSTANIAQLRSLVHRKCINNATGVGTDWKELYKEIQTGIADVLAQLEQHNLSLAHRIQEEKHRQDGMLKEQLEQRKKAGIAAHGQHESNASEHV